MSYQITSFKQEVFEGYIYLGAVVVFPMTSGLPLNVFVTNRGEDKRAPGATLRTTIDGWTLTVVRPDYTAPTMSRARFLLEEADALIAVLRAAREDEIAHERSE